MSRKGLAHLKVAQSAGLSRATVARALRGDEAILDETLHGIEGALNMPRGLLVCVRNGDIAQVRTMQSTASDPDLIRHVIYQMESAERATQIS
jgi:DNA-binding phage protein